MTDITYYIICAALTLGVLVGISLMSKVKTSVLGNGISAVCTGLAMLVTLVKYDILSDYLLWIFVILGLVVGLIGAYRVKMIQMPQAVAILNGFGGAASALVAAVSLISGNVLTGFALWAAALALIVGSITLTGSLVAGGKLAKVISQRPVVWKHHQLITVASLLASLGAVASSFSRYNRRILGHNALPYNKRIFRCRLCLARRRCRYAYHDFIAQFPFGRCRLYRRYGN